MLALLFYTENQWSIFSCVIFAWDQTKSEAQHMFYKSKHTIEQITTILKAEIVVKLSYLTNADVFL